MSYASVMFLDGKMKPAEVQAWFFAFAGSVQEPKLIGIEFPSKGVFAHWESVYMTLSEYKPKGEDWRATLGKGKALAIRHSYGTPPERKVIKEPTFAGVKRDETRLLDIEQIWGNEPDYQDRVQCPIFLFVSAYHLDQRNKVKKGHGLAKDPLTAAKIKKAQTLKIKNRKQHACAPDDETVVFADQVTPEDQALFADLWEKQRVAAHEAKTTLSQLRLLLNHFEMEVNPDKKADADNPVTAADLGKAKKAADKATAVHLAVAEKVREAEAKVRATLYEVEESEGSSTTRWAIVMGTEHAHHFGLQG